MIANVTERPNESWLASLRGGGPEADRAHRELCDLVRRGLRKTLSKRGPIDDATLDDLTQVAVVRVVEKLDTFRGASKFSTWVFSVAIRAAYSELRRAAWQHVSLGDFELDGQPGEAYADDSEDAETGMQRKRVLQILERAIREELSDRQRQGILAELAGLPIAAIEAKMDSNRNAVYKLLHDARMKLKNALLAAGVTERDVRSAFEVRR